MRRVAKIVLFLPVTLLMLHALIQHEHDVFSSEETYFVSCKHHFDFLGVFQHAFELDERQNHLEEFQIATESSSDFQLYVIRDVDILLSPSCYTEPVLKPFKEVFAHHFVEKELSQRGPPATS